MALPKNIRGSKLGAPRKLASNDQLATPLKSSGTTSQSRDMPMGGKASAGDAGLVTPVKGGSTKTSQNP